eukprot:6142521-Karenia_brevis.AAC.1
MPVGRPFPTGAVEQFRWSQLFEGRAAECVLWDRYGVGGEGEREEEMEEEEAVGEDPERLRLQEDAAVVKKIGDPMLPSEQE